MSEIISANDLRVGTLIDSNGIILEVVDFKKVRTGKGGAFVSTKLKKYLTGGMLEKTFRSDEKVIRARIFSKTMTYLYKNGEMFHFMDNKTYEEIVLDKKVVGNESNYLVEDSEVVINYYNDVVIGIKLPLTVKLKVISTEAGIKGNTVSNVTKSAKLETGMMIQIPIFINPEDIISIDTRIGEYIERVEGGK